MGITNSSAEPTFPYMPGKVVLQPHVAFGLVLHKLRQSARLSQEQLGLELGVQRNFISLMETGQN